MRGNPDKIKPYQWKRGQPSPNPSGRPRTAILTRAIRAQLESELTLESGVCTVAEAIASVLVGNALSGDIRAIREVADRAEGRPTLAVTIQDGLESESREEREARLQEILASAGLRLVPIDPTECQAAELEPGNEQPPARVDD